MAIAEPSKYTFKPFPTDEYIYAVITGKPTDEQSKFDEAKRVLKVMFKIEQDMEFDYTDEATGKTTSRNIKGDTIPRIFPLSWPNERSKRESLLFSFVEALLPVHAVKGQAFDTDLLEGVPCFIMIEDQKTDDGGKFQKVVKWKAPKTRTSAASREATPTKVAAKSKVTVPDDGETVDY